MKPPILKTNRFILKPYRKKDETRFIEMSTDSDSVQFMGGAEGGIEAEKALFNSIFKLYKSNDSNRWFWIWGIYENDLLIGHFELKETDHTSNNELEIVYMVHPKQRKSGVMTEVLELFKTKQYEFKKKIIATVNPKNVKSISLLNKWGILKQDKIKNKDTENYYYKFWLK
jgi:RimJ/RimL family protein N-acetyltransferase